MPCNAMTGRPYSGGNVLILWAAAMSSGFPNHRWLTFKQGQDVGANVRRGEKGTPVVFAKPMRDDEEDKAYVVARVFTVFNVAQLDNLPELPAFEQKTVATTHADARALLERTGMRVTHGGNDASYNRTFDRVVMPPVASFDTEDDYWQTLWHEGTHWTGHKDRLAREMGKRFGDQAYAAEELVAELGSAFVCATLQIPTGFRSSAYIANWLQIFKNDTRAIFTAASHASKAADFLQTKQQLQAAE